MVFAAIVAENTVCICTCSLDADVWLITEQGTALEKLRFWFDASSAADITWQQLSSDAVVYLNQ